MKQSVLALTGDYSLPVNFTDLKAGLIDQAAKTVISSSEDILTEIKSLKSKKTFENTFLRIDDLYNQLGRMHNLLDLISNTHPTEEIRKQAMISLAETGKMFNSISLDSELYEAVKPVYKKNHLGGWQARLMDKIISSFERNGCNLDENSRTELKKIKDTISDLGIEFSNNIDSDHHEFRFTAEEADGLPESYIRQRKQPDGSILVTLDYPDYHPFMKFCKSDDARKKLYTAFVTRAKANQEVLNKLISARNRMAALLGYRSYADYNLTDNVAKTPQAVWNFEKSLQQKITPKARKDYALLIQIKKEETGSEDPILSWQSGYFTEKLLLDRYHLDSQKLKEYFPIDSVLKGIFAICEKLFGVKITEKENQPVWHKDTRYFEVIREENKIAHFYLDLFPRKNKFSHAACFGITGGKQLADGTYQTPSAALVCNFPKPTAELPSLLTHNEVVTLFHEFGHLTHHLLTRSPVYYFAGTNTAIDFVEVPSQLFENWAWDYESLKLFAHHYKTGEVLPEVTFKK